MWTGNGTEVVESGSELEIFVIESVDHDSLNQVQSMTGIVVDIQGNEGMIETERIIPLAIDIEIHMTDAITGHPHPLDQVRSKFVTQKDSSVKHSDISYRRSSRSPARRRPISPPPPYQTKATPRHSRSPPAKRMRLQRQSDLPSPRSPSPLRKAHEPNSTPRASEHRTNNDLSISRSPQETPKNSSSNTTMDDSENRGLLPSLSQSERSPEISCPAQSPARLQPEQKDYVSTALPASFNSLEAIHKLDRIQPKKDETNTDVKTASRPLSPPKHPRSIQPPNIMLHRPQSNSPPRGPRNHSRNMAVPASSSFPASGLPRGPRRQHPLPTSLISPDPAPTISADEPPGPAIGPDLKLTLPAIPAHKPRPALTPELDIEVCFPYYPIGFLCFTEFDRSRACKHTVLILLLITYRYQKEPDEHYTSWILPHSIYALQKVDARWQIVKWKKHVPEYLVSMLP